MHVSIFALLLDTFKTDKFQNQEMKANAYKNSITKIKIIYSKQKEV